VKEARVNETIDDGKPVFEIRTYRAHAGQREQLMAMMRDSAVPFSAD
jgi:hypothetical protein